MKKLSNIDNICSEAGLYKQVMLGYKVENYILQVFDCCSTNWYYVLVYDENDTLIGVFTVIMDETNICTKILMAKRTTVIENLIDRFIEFRKEKLCKN